MQQHGMNLPILTQKGLLMALMRSYAPEPCSKLILQFKDTNLRVAIKQATVLWGNGLRVEASGLGYGSRIPNKVAWVLQ